MINVFWTTSDAFPGRDEIRPVRALFPIMAAVSIAFLIIGLALPVLPLHIHRTLGLGTFVIGLVTGSQFGASLITRVWAGRLADRRGPKRALIVGLLIAAMAGLLYLGSLVFVGVPVLSVTVLLFGRALLGGAESLIITGAVSWGLTLSGPKSAGRVIAWMGIAMFAALAVGAPLGTALYSIGGFATVAIATALVPLVAMLVVVPLTGVSPQRGPQIGVMKVMATIWVPGCSSALSSIGFGAMIAFSSLLLAQRGWNPLWLPFSAFAISLVVARLSFGDLPDRLGGANVALVCALIEAAGLTLIWMAPGMALAAVGSALAGFGYSLVYPGLGAEAVRRSPPQSRGLAMGAYTAFLDVALGLGSPALGLVGSHAGLSSVFLAAATAALAAAVMIAQLLRRESWSARRVIDRLAHGDVGERRSGERPM